MSARMKFGPPSFALQYSVRATPPPIAGNNSLTQPSFYLSPLKSSRNYGNSEKFRIAQVRRTQIRQGGEQNRGQCDAQKKKRHTPLGQGRQRWKSKEPQAGHRHRSFRGAQERRKSPAESRIEFCAFLARLG